MMASNKLTTTEMQKEVAAYALNMCTVSVSQIVDYQDLYIMDQEYEMILNNLNLENMPKDEALLSILKEILNVITYFRIQDGDRKMIEAEYQHRMKNAIWSAVPNITGLVGSSPASIVTSLAMQVGVGYMNYRRQKAENLLEHRQEQWKLQRTAIEQLNALRQELFATAWRLADTYKFPDEYRLTERQIKQYNEMLLDPDPLKRYERLDYISSSFKAYPPAIYQMGRAASEVFLLYRERAESITDPLYKEECLAMAHTFKNKALEHYSAFLAETHHNLLRQDQLRAACALEEFDIRMLVEPRRKSSLKKLLQSAIKDAGGAHDVIELCVFGYLRLGEYEEAKKELSMLTNEQYNTVLNAQILSRLYIEEQTPEAQMKHRILGERVGTEQLYPWVNVRDNPESINMFLHMQKNILSQKFYMVLQDVIYAYTVKYNKAFPYSLEEVEVEKDDAYYSDEDIFFEQRLSNAKATVERYQQQYLEMVTQAMPERLAILNDLCKHIARFPGGSMKDFYIDIANELRPIAERLGKPTEEDLSSIISATQFSVLTKTAFINLADHICARLRNCESLSDICQLETRLFQFCAQNGYQFPDLLGKPSGKEDPVDPKWDLRIIMGSRFESFQKEAKEKADMLHKIEEYRTKLYQDGSAKVRLWSYQDPGFADYFNSKQGKRFWRRKEEAIAVLDDQSVNNIDLIFVTSGIYKAYFGEAVRDNLKITNLIPLNATLNMAKTIHQMITDTSFAEYCSIQREASKVKISEDYVSYKKVNADALVNLCSELGHIHEKYQPHTSNKEETEARDKISLLDELYNKFSSSSVLPALPGMPKAKKESPEKDSFFVRLKQEEVATIADCFIVKTCKKTAEDTFLIKAIVQNSISEGDVFALRTGGTTDQRKLRIDSPPKKGERLSSSLTEYFFSTKADTCKYKIAELKGALFLKE